MSETYHVRCLSTAMSPITHMARVEGNESIIAREAIITPAGVRFVPRLSGNALRHRMVREPAARFIVDRYGLAGKLTLRQINFLFHGGTLTESNARRDSAAIAEACRVLPMLHLLGGSLPDAILSGTLAARFGVLVCRENADRVSAMLPPELEAGRNLRPAEAFVDGWQYTRGDSRNAGVAAAPTNGEDDAGGGSQMIFAGQSVIPGAAFAHGFVLQHANELDLGCLMLSLSLWLAGGATVGGQSARGHGMLDTLFWLDHGDVEAALRAYVDHVDSVRDDAIAWLNDTFASSPKAAKPAKKAKRETAESHGNP